MKDSVNIVGRKLEEKVINIVAGENSIANNEQGVIINGSEEADSIVNVDYSDEKAGCFSKLFGYGGIDFIENRKAFVTIDGGEG